MSSSGEGRSCSHLENQSESSSLIIYLSDDDDGEEFEVDLSTFFLSLF